MDHSMYFIKMVMHFSSIIVNDFKNFYHDRIEITDMG